MYFPLGMCFYEPFIIFWVGINFLCCCLPTPMTLASVRSILLLPLVARCIFTIDVCIWRMFVFMSVVVIVWGSV